MEKLTIAQASAYFSISKEAIHNRIRRGTLNCVIENGVKYITLETDKNSSSTSNQVSANSNTSQNSSSDDKYYKYIENENERLRKRIESLESETTHLRNQREQMLIEEKKNIEAIYKQRDEQLKNVLNVVATKFLSNMSVENIIEEASIDEPKSDESLPALIIEDSNEQEQQKQDKKSSLISLKKFLKLKDFSQKKKDKITKRFTKLANEDSRIILKKDKIYLDPAHFDYKDLL